jgi:hypothetical protein
MRKLGLSGLFLSSLLAGCDANQDILLYKLENEGPVTFEVYEESKEGAFNYSRVEVYDSERKLIGRFKGAKKDVDIKLVDEKDEIYELKNGNRYYTKKSGDVQKN